MPNGRSAVGVAKSEKPASGSAEGGTETKSPKPGEVGGSSGGREGGVLDSDIRVVGEDAGTFLSGNKGLALVSRGLDEIKSSNELDWLDDA